MRSVLSSLTRHKLLCYLPFASSASSVRLPVYSRLLGTGHDMWALRCNYAARMASSSCTVCDVSPAPYTKRPRNSSNCSHTSKAGQYTASQHAASTNTIAMQLAQHCGVQQCSQAAAAHLGRPPGSCAVVAAAAVADELGTGQQQQQRWRQHMVWQLPGAAQVCVPLVTVDTNSSSSNGSSRVLRTSSFSDSMHDEARTGSSSSRRRRKKLQGLDQERQQQQQAVQQKYNPAAADAVTAGAAAGVGARHETQQPLSSSPSITAAVLQQQQQQQLQAITIHSDYDSPDTQQQQQQSAASIFSDCDTSFTCREQQQQEATKVLLLGIDPDTNGAVAVIVADLLPHHPAGPGSSSSSHISITTHQSNGSNSRIKKHKKGNPNNSSWSQHPEGDQHQQQRQQQLYVDLSGAVVSVYDMPVEAIPLRKKTKTSPQRYRRRLDVARTVATIKKILHQHQQHIMQHTSSVSAASSSSSSVPNTSVAQLTQDYPSSSSSSSSSSSMDYPSSSSRDTTTITTTSPSSSSSNSHPSPSTILKPNPLNPNPLNPNPVNPNPLNPNPLNPNSLNPDPQPIILRAVLEVCSIVPTNGSLSTLNQGFSLGAWTAALLALGVEISTVHVRQWKKDLGLMGCDKDASRQLAQKIFQQAGNDQDRLLSRKKDHGRAEALLIAAWGCGWSAADHSSSSSSSKKNKGSTRSGAKSKVPTSSGLTSSSDLISSSSSNSRNGGDEDEANFSSLCNSSQSGIMSLSPQQGPLRDIIRMDGGMHLVGELDNVVTGSTTSKGSRSKALALFSDVFGGIDSYDNDDVLLYGATAVEPASEPRQRKNNSRSSRKREQAAAAAAALSAEG